MKDYYNLDQIRMRLRNCIVSLDNRFVYIQEIEQGSKSKSYKIYYTDLRSRAETFTGFIPEQELRFDNFRLGMGNTKTGVSRLKHAVFVSRMPTRVARDGLCSSNTIGYYVLKSRWLPFDNLPVLDSILNNVYPSYEEIIESIKPDESVAFSRNFAVTGKGHLLFRDRGVVGIANKTPELSKDFFYLRELLNQELR